MKKLYCVICGKYRKFEKPKISCILEKTLVLSIICSKCKNEDEKKYLKKMNQLRHSEFLVCLKIYNYFKNMSQEFRLKIINETRHYFLEEIEQNELMSKQHEKACTILNYVENFLILASTITGSISISAFDSLLVNPVGITSSAIGLKFVQ